jgi:hypothetical protein
LVASSFLPFLSDFVFLDFFAFLAAILVPLFNSRYFDYNQRPYLNDLEATDA